MSEIALDQAAGLQQMLAASAGAAPAPMALPKPGHQASSLLDGRNRTPCRAIAVAGGKGGVGKSTVAVNLAMSLSIAGHDVMLLDADMGLANVDVMLGLTPSRHIGHLLDGECTLEELLLPAARGLQVVPAGSGTRRLAQLNNGEHAAIIRAFDELAHPPEYLLVDTAAGLSDNVTMFAAAASEVILVVCDEPASLTDAYGLTKVLNRDFGVRRVRMVANMVRNEGDARLLHQKLARVSDRFLDVVIDFSGWIPHDERLRQAIRRQCAVVDLWPSSHSAQAFKKLAELVDKWAEPDRTALDRIAFFGGRTVPADGVPK
ncbi:MinD/ParA family protein [Rhodanobacter sp. AS-Z3]|uniref:MinD/ParA family ATP-binding protein n=1 Tax=Rhodanobacter sp. AS-Z3 TaxID=3031330 RepID=UPI00247A27B8|nr:MinD/ParA family protein [Rhodanobacter sp. AS-Z3]WEN14595.1 MinD/ParA family protein [Rhodanobacter sp. AS-Z3]